MSRAVAVAAVVLVVASFGAGPTLAQSQQNGLQTPDGFDTTTFRLTVYGNGSATWTIEHHQPLANRSEVEQFETYAQEFETNETPLYANFVEDATLLTRLGANETGRNMSARTFRRSASVDPAQSQGTVRMSFLWTNLGRTDANRVVVSDVFDGGFYVGAGQRMVVERGPGLAFSTVEPTPDLRSAPDSLATSESLTWVGEQSFNDSRPYVALAPQSAVDGQSGTATGNVSVGDTADFVIPVAAFALLAVLFAAVVAWRTGAVAAVSNSGGEDGGAAAETATSPEPEPAVDEQELLSDDDRVIKLLEDNGGRMRQVDIVESTEWSKSKVSMLLSEMEEDGAISKLRVGRENIISLVGQEPDAAGSPFDEE